MTDRLGNKRSVVGGPLAFGATLLLLPSLSGTLPSALLAFALATFCCEFTLVSYLTLLSKLAPDACATCSP